jgi:biotin carboxylase
MIEDKWIMVLGGSNSQKHIIKNAHELKLKVVLVDSRSNAESKDAADIFCNVDPKNFQTVLEIARTYQIKGVFSDQNDYCIEALAYINKEMNFLGNSVESSRLATNKLSQKKYLSKISPELIPQFWIFNTKETLEEFVSENPEKDFVLKPTNSQGSRGVIKINSRNIPKIEESQFYNTNGKVEYLVEEYIGGYEFSVESIIVEGEIFDLLITRKYHYEKNDCLDQENTYLDDIPEEIQKALLEANSKVIKGLNLYFGLTHSEYKFYNGHVFLMEAAARGGGGGISSEIIPFMTDFDPMNYLIKYSIGMSRSKPRIQRKNNFCIMRFFNWEPGQVKLIQVPEWATKACLKLEISIQVNETVKYPENSADRPGFFIVGGLNRQSTIELANQVEKSIVIEYK